MYKRQSLYAQGGFPLVISDTIEKAALLQSLGVNVNLAPVCDVSNLSLIHISPFLKRSERQIVIPDNFLKIARIGGGKSRGRFAVLGNLGIIPGAAGRRSACIFGFSKESVVDNHLKGRAFVAILIGVVPRPVSYTHLAVLSRMNWTAGQAAMDWKEDVYKRQVYSSIFGICANGRVWRYWRGI